MENWFEHAPPDNFKPAVEIAGCYCIWEKKVLFLKRHIKKPYGQTWGVPAGKLENNETPRACVIRETREETGIHLADHLLKSCGTLHCRIPEMDFIYHMFYQPFATLPPILLELNEHTDHCWVTVKEALSMPLIIGGGEALKHFLTWKAQQESGKS